MTLNGLMRVRVRALRHQGQRKGSYGTLAPQGVVGSIAMHTQTVVKAPKRRRP